MDPLNWFTKFIILSESKPDLIFTEPDSKIVDDLSRDLFDEF